ncbi:hypothetical protein JW859_07135 [bacterium]|nr:hypothetical protein [bacterium]
MRRLVVLVLILLPVVAGCDHPFSLATSARLDGDSLTVEFLDAYGPPPGAVYLVEFDESDFTPVEEALLIKPPSIFPNTPRFRVMNANTSGRVPEPEIDTTARLIAICNRPGVSRNCPASVVTYQWNQRLRQKHIYVELEPIPASVIDSMADRNVYAIGVNSGFMSDSIAVLMPIERAKPFSATPYLIILAVWLICLGIPLTWLWLSGRKQKKGGVTERRLPAGQE